MCQRPNRHGEHRDERWHRVGLPCLRAVISPHRHVPCSPCCCTERWPVTYIGRQAGGSFLRTSPRGVHNPARFPCRCPCHCAPRSTATPPRRRSCGVCFPTTRASSTSGRGSTGSHARTSPHCWHAWAKTAPARCKSSRHAAYTTRSAQPPRPISNGRWNGSLVPTSPNCSPRSGTTRASDAARLLATRARTRSSCGTVLRAAL